MIQTSEEATQKTLFHTNSHKTQWDYGYDYVLITIGYGYIG